MLSEVSTAAAKRPGTLFVVSSPSGGGKGTLVDRLLKAVPDLTYSISYTTRTPRDGEMNGREYFFVTRQQFEAMMKADEFLECAQVHSNLYGTSRQQVLKETAAGHDMVLEVDVQGAASVRKLVLDSVSIFIVPPSFELLRKRLIARGTDSAAQLEIRLRKAPEELKDYKLFDYVIINDDLDRAAKQLAAIVWAERARRIRQEEIVREVVRSFPDQ
jgi:guanylate kinase